MHPTSRTLLCLVLLTLARPHPGSAETNLPPISSYQARVYERHGQDCLTRFGPSDACILLLETATRFDPNRAMARYTLGWAYYRAGREAQALAELASAYRIDPALSRALLVMGAIYLDQGKLTLAEKKFEQYEEAVGADPLADFGVATVAVSRGDFEKAAAHLRLACDRDPGVTAWVQADPRWRTALQDPSIQAILAQPARNGAGE